MDRDITVRLRSKESSNFFERLECPPNMARERSPGSGLWREFFQAAVRFLRDRRVGKLFFELLVDAGGFLRIALAQGLGKLQQNERARHEDRGMFRQVAEHLGGLGCFSSALVNHSCLILRLGYKLLVPAGADFLQLFESLVVT